MIATLAACAAHVATAGGMAAARASFPPSGVEMAWIPAGTAEIGCATSDADCFAEERPHHRVTLSHGFWLALTEVTVGQYRAFAAATNAVMPVQPPGSRDNHPVVDVSWNAAAAYCTWAGGRLPTEAEWEVAARGGLSDAVFPWGDEASHERANFSGVEGRDRWSETAPVASFEPNGFGLFDMAGNVWEWCADWFSPSAYTDAPVTDPAGPADGAARVLRGGSFEHGARSMRASNRGRFAPTGHAPFIGFRCARDGEPPAGPAPAATGESEAAPATPSEPAAATPAPVPARGEASAPAEAEAPPASPAPAATSVPPLATPTAANEPTPAPPAPARPAGFTSRFAPSGAEMAWIPPATVEVGCVRGDGDCDGDEQPRHPVVFARGFWIDVTEVTVGQYRAFASAAGRPMPHQPEWADDAHPVVNVTWDAAAAYCAWAGDRLPTESEWEAAARGGRDGEKYVTGARMEAGEVNADGVTGADRFEKSAPVGSFAPNGFGLLDMAGNVWEWCADWYDPRAYASAAAIDPRGPESGSERVVRGGSWTSNRWRMRTSYRFRLAPSETSVTLGFRCARGADPGDAAARP